MQPRAGARAGRKYRSSAPPRHDMFLSQMPAGLTPAHGMSCMAIVLCMSRHGAREPGPKDAIEHARKMSAVIFSFTMRKCLAGWDTCGREDEFS